MSGEVRRPEGRAKHRDDSKLPKATKTEESADSKEVNKPGKYLLFCSPVLVSVFRLRAERFLSCFAWIIKFITTRGPLEMPKPDRTEWKVEEERCTELLPQVDALIDKEFPANSQIFRSKPLERLLNSGYNNYAVKWRLESVVEASRNRYPGIYVLASEADCHLTCVWKTVSLLQVLTWHDVMIPC